MICLSKVSRVVFRTFLVVVVLSFFIGVSSLGATEQKGVKEEVGEAATAIKDYSVEQKDAAVAKAKELMEDLDENIDAWQGEVEEKWDDLQESSRQNYKMSKEKFQEQREELGAWFDRLQDSSAEAWDETKQGFSNAYDALSKSWSSSKEEMEKEK